MLRLYVMHCLLWLWIGSISTISSDLGTSDISGHGDPTEYFIGSQHRPKLEILKPENGQVLNEGVLDIEISISGYALPSHFDDSSTCIALSKDKGTIVVERCFDQSPELVFHVNGLTPGENYTLRVLFLERGKVIALSVRSFKVGGVIGVLAHDEKRAVSIQTALQVALQHQVNGMHLQAERIYQRILSESPSNADALNRLGVNFYQQGDHMMAIAYIQQALVSNHSVLADSYYNLGEVYRVIGQIDKAKEHFELSLSINMNHTSAMYKLGLIYQQNLRQFELAKALYRRLLKLELRHDISKSLSLEELHECKVRECDLLDVINRDKGVSGDSYEILNCWKEGIALFPHSGLMFNELGSNYLQRGMHEAAYHAFTNAVKLDYYLGFVNRAAVLEIQGHIAEARLSFQESIAEAIKRNLPHFHVSLRLATLLPRVLPSSELELKEHRLEVERSLDDLLASSTSSFNIENAAPIHYGFSTGYFLAFHGLNNVALKQRMYKSYMMFCPALKYGHFASGPDANKERYAVNRADKALSIGMEVTQGNVFSRVKGQPDDDDVSGVGFVHVIYEGECSDADDASATTVSYWAEDSCCGEWELFLVEKETGLLHYSTSMTPSRFTPGSPLYSDMIYDDSFADMKATQLSNTVHVDMPDPLDSSRRQQAVRVGFVSRFFYSHPVGYLYEEIIRLLSASSNSAALRLVIEVFMLEARDPRDPVTSNIEGNANVIHKVPPDLNELIEAIRSARLDIVVYTDVGVDPITYFAAFSKLAPIQVTGLGHPDTSGISTIDYYISDEVDLSVPASTHYSEMLIKMPGMGSCFVDRVKEYATALHSPRTALLERAKYIEKIGIPRSAHLYVVVQPFYALHSVFDECIARILMQDKLGYVVILNPGNTWHSSHHTLFFNRLIGRLSEDALKRLLTFQYLQTADFIHKSIAAAHAVLDPFPSATYHSSLHALSLGIPVITLPSKHMIGRQCLSLYKRMDYLDLVVSSPLEYATLALTLAHKPKIRQHHVNFLMKNRNKLFDCAGVEKLWKNFFVFALMNSNDPNLVNKTACLNE